MGIMQLLMSSVASGGGEYVDGLFETTVYPSSTNAIDVESGIDNLNEGGMVWIKNRDNSISNTIYSTANPATSSTSDHRLRTDSDAGLQNTGPSTGADGTITWNSDGWTGANGKSYIIENGYGDYVAYNFRKCAGFFDMVTYNGSPSVQSIAHNLGCVPGCIMVKKTNGAGNWMVYHKHMDPTAPQDYNLKLDGTNYRQDKDTVWNDTAPTKTHFTVGTYGDTNNNGDQYVAYLFADGADSDAQVFGTGGNENIIKCGTFTAPGSGSTNVDLGWEPQWLLIKRYDAGSTEWVILNPAQRWNHNGAVSYIMPNSSGTEINSSLYMHLNSRGFSTNSSGLVAGDYIYMAIRRDMKPAEVATNVFSAGTRSGSGSVANTTSTVFTDMSITCRLDSAAEYNSLNSRLLGTHTFKTTGEDAYGTGLVSAWDVMTGMLVTGSNGAANVGNLVDYSFKRQPGFFDVATHAGNPSNNAVTVYHNLGVKPELIITKCDSLSTTGEWVVTCPAMSGTISGGSNDGSNYDYITGYLSRNNYFSWRTYNTSNNMTQDVTTTTITYAGNSSGGNASLNYAGRTYINYLFASKSKVSAIGQYTGTGSAVNVDCGFDAAARFILIKRIGLDPVEVTGDWYIYDSARGIVSGNDPYYLLNLTAAEVTGTDYIDPYASGFTVTSSAPAALNSTGTYLYLAIA